MQREARGRPFRPGLHQRPTAPPPRSPLWPGMFNSDPKDQSLWKRTRHCLPVVPDRRGRPVFARPSPGYPDFGPRPASAARPPRPAPGPRWRQRSVTAPLLSFLRSAPCQKEALLHPKWQGLRPSAGGASVSGDPRRGRGLGGRRAGGRWLGQCVGGEGSRTAAAAASSQRPPQLFVQPREVPAPSLSGPARDSTLDDAPRSWGPAPQSSPLCTARKQT